MNIFLTNDDGYLAYGILGLAENWPKSTRSRLWRRITPNLARGMR